MGRKKIGVVGGQAQEACEIKPFCYYCDKEFDSVKTLITHQRTKHFNCAECSLKFDTVTGLRVHMLNAYKKTMKEVPNAIPGRESPDMVVHGMEGLPKGLVEEKTRKALAEKAEKDKQREEEARERLKQLSAARAAEAREAGDAEDKSASGGGGGSGPPEAKRPALASAPPPPPPAGADAPSAPPPAPPSGGAGMPRPPQRGQQPELLYLQQPPPPPATASSSSTAPPGPPPPSDGAGAEGGMPGLSPAVQKLLNGEGGPDMSKAPVVPGLVLHEVPTRLRGLHPAALQALAFVGALPAKGSGGGDGGSSASSVAALSAAVAAFAAPAAQAPPLHQQLPMGMTMGACGLGPTAVPPAGFLSAAAGGGGGPGALFGQPPPQLGAARMIQGVS